MRRQRGISLCPKPAQEIIVSAEKQWAQTAKQSPQKQIDRPLISKRRSSLPIKLEKSTCSQDFVNQMSKEEKKMYIYHLNNQARILDKQIDRYSKKSYIAERGGISYPHPMVPQSCQLLTMRHKYDKTKDQQFSKFNLSKFKMRVAKSSQSKKQMEAIIRLKNQEKPKNSIKSPLRRSIQADKQAVYIQYIKNKLNAQKKTCKKSKGSKSKKKTKAQHRSTSFLNGKVRSGSKNKRK